MLDKQLINKNIFIQCTWVKVYIYPIKNRGYCMRSYDRTEVNQMYYRIKYYDAKVLHLGRFRVVRSQIAIATGNYHIDDDGVKWIESYPLYCDRAEINENKGWFRESDIWYQGKAAEPNRLDWDVLDYKPETGLTDHNTVAQPVKNDSSWLAWLTGGITLLKVLG